MSTQATHTPGPWTVWRAEVVRFGKPDDFICDPYAGAREATSTTHRKLMPIDEREANARLIAAAPELLEALKVILETADLDCGSPVVHRKVVEQARAAIGKAIGQ